MFNRTTIIRASFWTILALVAGLLPIRPFLGGGQPFTAFEFMGPLGGLFLGATSGAITAISVKGIVGLLTGGMVGTFALARLLTPGAAAVYLAGKRWILLVPFGAILAFVTHPVGREVAAFSLFWIVPLLLWPLRASLLARCLGATMTAHALGGAFFIWFVPTTTNLWQSLVPIVIGERLLFAAGMTVTAMLVEHASRAITSQWPNGREVLSLRRV